MINLLTLSLLFTLVARLWFLQVLAAPHLRKEADQTSIRLIHKQAPRGFVFDRNLTALAQNRTALTVALDVSRLPAERADTVLPKLASVLDLSERDVRKVVEDVRYGIYEPRPLALDVQEEKVVYLLEHQNEFPGVLAVEIPVREYPLGALAAHAVGHVGKISETEFKERQKRAQAKRAQREKAKAAEIEVPPEQYRADDLIGKIGIERVYEEDLRGQPGYEKITVNVRGEKVDTRTSRKPVRGWDAILTIDKHVQRSAEEALEQGAQVARRLLDHDTGRNFAAPAGAVVALDPRNGEILALASNPSFDPNIFVGSAPPGELERINDPQSHKPMFNRAIAERTAPGSTFKPLTAVAAWEVGGVSPERIFTCPGFLEVGNRRFKDWDPKGHSKVELSRSLSESCDVVYYTLGVEMNQRRSEIGEHLQSVARSFGFGSRTGVDLLGENAGVVPDIKYKERLYKDSPQAFERRWFDGDSANLAIGQGLLAVTPLQLAAAYGALANGGTVYRPHVLKCLAELNISSLPPARQACDSGSVKVPEKAKPKVLSEVRIADKEALRFVSDAMGGVGVDKGTAAPAFAGFPFEQVPVAGKTGTAQVAQKQDFSWFAAYAPANDPQIVVVALVEEAGTGAQIAAPIVRRVMETYFGLPVGNISAGARAD
ncbi:MAG TPA: penicillin-binding protein 2 [Actinomycetota bacterium]|nr:penicillin-binding protein 2 [Actinomycetota bacterium]